MIDITPELITKGYLNNLKVEGIKVHQLESFEESDNVTILSRIYVINKIDKSMIQIEYSLSLVDSGTYFVSMFTPEDELFNSAHVRKDKIEELLPMMYSMYLVRSYDFDSDHERRAVWLLA